MSQTAERRASVRQNVKQFRQRQEIKPFLNEKGDIDIVAYFNSPSMKLRIAGMVDDAFSGTKVNSQFLKWLSQIMGIYTEKREETVKVELTTADRQQVAIGLITELKRERESSGVCPVCGISEAVCDQPRLDTRPE